VLETYEYGAGRDPGPVVGDEANAGMVVRMKIAEIELHQERGK
jgi:hypothetical protein